MNVVKLWSNLVDTRKRLYKIPENQRLTKSCCASGGTHGSAVEYWRIQGNTAH